MEKEERVKLVSRSLKKLKSKYADILYLHYYLELPQNEIVQIYGISPGRVSALITAARNTLKRLMENLSSEGSNKDKKGKRKVFPFPL